MSAEDPRWVVDTPEDGSHDVGATSMNIHQSGALVFLDSDGDVLIAYAPHAWTSVHL